MAGAAGVMGRSVVPLLTRAGHDVVGTTRRATRCNVIEGLGARAVVCDAFDASGLRAAVVDARPDVIIHELTSIPAVLNPRRIVRDFAENDRLRSEGTRNLMAAAVAAGVPRVIAQSVSFAYAPEGGAVKDEDERLWLDAPGPARRLVRAVADLEDSVTSTPGVAGVVLRYGYFYGPGTAYAADGSLAHEVKRRRLPVIGRGTGVFSFIHIDDGAAATALALDRGDAGIYNVTDDDPVPASEWLPYYAEVIGAKRPFRVPAFLGRLGGGAYSVYLMTRQRGASNARAKKAFGWEPRYASWREGFRASLG